MIKDCSKRKFFIIQPKNQESLTTTEKEASKEEAASTIEEVTDRDPTEEAAEEAATVEVEVTEVTDKAPAEEDIIPIRESTVAAEVEAEATKENPIEEAAVTADHDNFINSSTQTSQLLLTYLIGP